VSRTKIARAIEAGHASINGKAVTKSGSFVEPGDVVDFDLPGEPLPHQLEPVQMNLVIAYEDDDLLVVLKPRGLATHPAPTLSEPSLVEALLGQNIKLSQSAGTYRPGIVHRLDKETTGLLAVAKNDLVHEKLSRQFAAKSAERRYVAWLEGQIASEKFIIDAPIGRDTLDRQKMTATPKGKPARTHVKKLGTGNLGTLVALRLETGRTHQIRVHCSQIGHGVRGDSKYHPDKGLPLQLHAAYLAFEHPMSGGWIETYADPPEDFVEHEKVQREEVVQF
jgi:23S rRNA pseudouridine1911/1915/1917 synthase